MSRRAVFVNRYFHPDAAPTAVLASDVAFDWAARGVEVHAIAGRGSYADDSVDYPADELVSGVRVHRVWTGRSRRRSIAARLRDYGCFHALAGWRLWRLLRRDDVVVVKTDPPLLSVTAAAVAALRGAKLVNWLQDVFPEVADRAGTRLAPAPAMALLRRLRDWSVRRAHANVVVGERMAALLAVRVGDAAIHVIPNWADGTKLRPAPPDSELRADWGCAGRFVVAYSGNLGRAHDVDTLLAAARRLSSRDDVAFSFVGGGHGMARVRAAGLPNVRIRGYVPGDALAAALAMADVHLVTLLPDFEGLVVPSKFYGVAAAGRPTIFVGDPDGEIGRLVRTHECGIVVASGDGAALADAIVQLRDAPLRCRELGGRARAAFEGSWDRPLALARWRGILRRACAGDYTG